MVFVASLDLLLGLDCGGNFGFHFRICGELCVL